MEIEEETIDDLLKDLKEGTSQNRLMKNKRLNKRNAQKPDEKKDLFPNLNTSGIYMNNIENSYPNEKNNNNNNFQKFNGKSNNLKINENLFENYAFIIIPDKNELSDKRIKILSQQILRRKGTFFDFSGHFEDFELFLKENFRKLKLVISSKTNLYEVFYPFLISILFLVFLEM